MLRTQHQSLGRIEEGIVFLAVSPDNRHVAHVIERAEKFFVVRDGVREKDYDWIAKKTPLFSPDSRRMAYVAMIRDQDPGPYPVVDGVELRRYSSAGMYLRFSPDSRRLAYAAAQAPDGRQFVVVDEVAGPEYDGIGQDSLRFSPDSRRLAYGARRGNAWCMVIDGQEQPEYDGLATPLVFSPDSRRWAYVARRGHGPGTKDHVVVDGVEGQSYDGTTAGTPLFSPDSRRLAFGAARGDKMFAVVDGEEGPAYQGVECLTFSPDSARVAYVAHRPAGGFLGLRRHGAFRAVIDGFEGKKYIDISLAGIRFSPDSRRTAYVMQNFDGWWAVIDGVEHGPYEGIAEGTPFFSDDGRHWAFGAGRGNGVVVVRDGVESPEYTHTAGMAFSPDSRRLAYAAQRGVAWHIIADGEETGEVYDGFLAGSRVVWDGEDKLHALAFRGEEFLGVEVEVLAG
jgi:hypothetical protein